MESETPTNASAVAEASPSSSPTPANSNQTAPPNQPIEPKRSALARLEYRSVEFRGPIPPPALLLEYDEVLPGAADRILTMAESQARHRQEMEMLYLKGQSERSDRGQWFGLIVALSGFAVAGLLGTQGHAVAAATIVGADLIALVSVFVIGKRAERTELNQKQPLAPKEDPGQSD